MARSKTMLSALMALLLLFTAFPVYAADQGNEAVSSVSSGSDNYVRIKNKWKSNYLYEGSDGVVRYGNTAMDNTFSQWLIEESNGVKRIKNRATGHYVTMAETAKRGDALYSRSITESTANDQWMIEESSRPGYVVIKNAGAPAANLVIHQEDQLGFAEVSGDINITFESPQWALEPVDPAGVPVRIANQFKAGKYLYEDKDGFVKFGDAAVTDTASHWFLETAMHDGASSGVLLRNRATGHYITQQAEAWMQLKAGAADGVKSEWLMADAATAGFVTFTNASSPQAPAKPYVLNTQFPDDTNVRANDWADITWGSSEWRLELASDVQPVRIAGYADDPAAALYLHESNGIVQYGTVNSADPSYLWILEDYDGNTLIRNLSTGHYVHNGSASAPTDPLQADNGSAMDATYQWTIDNSNIYDDYKTIQSAARPDEYVNAAEGASSAQAGQLDPDTNPAQWLFADPSASTDGSPQYVRIMNDWQSMYWYEDTNGDLKYGNIRNDDQRDQWLIERFQGRKRIKNRETGHYVNLQNITDGRIKVTDVEEDWKSAVWVIEDKGGGSRLIHNVLDVNDTAGAQKYINLQNLTKYAEYGIINPNWGSPRWRFVNVPADTPSNIRIKNKLNNQYLYEVTADGPDKGKVKYGDVAASDADSIWFPEDAGDGVGSVRLKNQGTGHYLSMEGVGGTVEQDAPDFKLVAESIYPQWGSAKWYLQDSANAGYVNIKSAWAGHYVYAASGNDAGYTKVSKLVASNDEGQFALEKIALPEAPLPATPIRLKNAATGQFLYENHGGIVLYGNIADNNGYSHWLLETENGQTRIRNRVTGDYMMVTGDYRYITTGPKQESSAAADSWSVEPQGSAYLIHSLLDGYEDEYINVQNGAGYAERGLFPASYGTLQWNVVSAPEAFTAPEMGEDRNEVTSTPIFDDTNYITITSGGKALNASSGAAALSGASASGQPSAQWLLQDYNGRKLIKNRATGKLLSADLKLKNSNSITDAEQWTMEERLGRFILVNASKQGALYADNTGLHYGEEGLANPAAWLFNPVAGIVVYEAENAFHSMAVATADSVSGYTGTGYLNGFSSSDELVRFVVHAQEAGTYRATIRYLSSDSGSVGVSVNGMDAESATLTAATETWKSAEIQLDLRAGVNTVTVQNNSSAILSVDSLTLLNDVNLDYRGATVGYTTYEAEHADTTGTLIGPSRAYREMASEASGRQAVSLDETGEYVEFTLTQPANSIVLRYAIPDSADGSGLQETLGLYVNGEFKQKLNLTSKYAWEYGSYPWSNDPKQGSAHRFFDEIHALIGDVPAGATIRLEKDADSTADYYVIDLADMEQVDGPLAKPDGFLSITGYGATANDGQDDTAALQAAMAAAKEAGTGVWIPEGTFEFRESVVNISDISIRGAGMWYTTLLGARFIGQGGTIGVYDLLVDGDLNVRDDEASTHGFEGEFGPGSVIQNVWVEHSKTGLWLTRLKGSTGFTDSLHMIGLRLRNLMADGINFCVGTSNSLMEQSDIRYPGDDGIAMWSAEGVASVNNTARFNTVSLPWLADNMVIFGGKDNKMTDNIAKDTITNGAGLAVSTRFNPVPFSGTTVVERNTLIRTGSFDTGYGVNLGAIWLFASDKDFSGNVIVRNNTVLDSTYAGLIVHGDYKVSGVTIENIVIDGAGTNGVEVTPNVKGSAIVDNVIVRGERISVVNDTNAQFAFEEQGKGFASLKKPDTNPGTGGSGSGSGVNNAGPNMTASTKTEDNDKALKEAVKTSSSVIVDAGSAAAGGKVSFSVQALLDSALANPNAVVVIQAGNASYSFPLNLLKQVLQANSLANPSAIWTFGVQQLSADMASKLQQDASKQGITPVGNPLDFSITVQDGSRTVVITAFGGSYVERSITLDGVQDADQMTVLVYDPASGSFSAVPALVSVKDGKTVLTIKSMGNSIYTAAKLDRAFADIANHWAQADIALLAKKGILNGVSAKSFAPEQAVTRAEFAAMLVRALGIRSANEARSFKDVAVGSWYAETVSIASGAGIINGYADGSFRPNNKVTREEMAIMAVKAFELASGSQLAAGDLNYKDAGKVSDWASDAVGKATGAGLLKGKPDGSFAPTGNVTRAEAATLLKRLLVSAELMNS
ncbi:S-layer homology domain-containing protein [Paenibacillus glycanilyticus]|uniref:Uncharacterized protein n=1 Tax=Paenibacillus glycanilyticus TaxID=126569 RepID=A0ABQ6G9U9_9BACL|nr:S-layer homology domain-containing protein [Paenibacillus glycanilyticus]GLX66820.1 hypothetical protein MU1_11640 [Paenibacillus glycanilyticus]